MLNAAVIGLGWWGKELVRSVQETSAFIRFSRGYRFVLFGVADLGIFGDGGIEPAGGRDLTT